MQFGEQVQGGRGRRGQPARAYGLGRRRRDRVDPYGEVGEHTLDAERVEAQQAYGSVTGPYAAIAAACPASPPTTWTTAPSTTG